MKRYGDEAVFIATKRADALLDQGDMQGCSAWVRIAKAIADLERKAAGRSDRCISATRSYTRGAEQTRTALAVDLVPEVPPPRCFTAGAVCDPVGC
jgi:hypothetical protein